jgi:uncharacterized membrane protein YgdD (TMEM256/DUF423 family)
MQSEIFRRIIVVVAALLGAAGVAAAAGATHSGDQALLGPLSLVALTHAPALLALATYQPAFRFQPQAMVIIAFGAILFSIDLAVRHFTGAPFFPHAAPIGGTALIAGWLVLAVSAAIGRQQPTST